MWVADLGRWVAGYELSIRFGIYWTRLLGLFLDNTRSPQHFGKPTVGNELAMALLQGCEMAFTTMV